MVEKCKKAFCLKQVNPDIPDLYFGIPFERDENYGACHLCDMKEKKEDDRTGLLISNRFIRMAPSL